MRAFAILLASTSLAWAAEPDVCRPFARDYTQIVINKVWMRAYTACLNSDETPVLPTDWQDALKHALPDATPPPPPLASTIPASGPVSKPPAPVNSVSVKPSPAEVCARAHRRVVFMNKYTWRCR